jgi:hypothetical protein
MTNTITRELEIGELDAVSGGTIMEMVGRALKAASAVDTGGGQGQGGQNDPAQMFQQILQQLTQGQG